MNGKRLAAALCALAIVGASAGGLPLDGLAITAGAEDPNPFDGSASSGTTGSGLNPGGTATINTGTLSCYFGESDEGTWEFDQESGTLTIRPTDEENGTAAIPAHFDSEVISTLGEAVSDITAIVISDGITSIGEEAIFDSRIQASSLTIAGSVTSIDKTAIVCTSLTSITFIPPELEEDETQQLSITGTPAFGVSFDAEFQIQYDDEHPVKLYDENNSEIDSLALNGKLTNYVGDKTHTLTWKSTAVANPTGTFDNGKGTWEFDQGTGTLNIRPTNEGGTADIPYYFLSNVSALADHFSDITAIVISDGITSIGEEAFSQTLLQASSVTIAGSVTSIAARAIVCNSITSVTFNSPELAKGGQQQLSMQEHAFEVSDNATFQINSSADPPVKLYDGEYETDGQALKGHATMYGGNLTWKKPAPDLTGTFGTNNEGTWEFYEDSGKLIIRPTNEGGTAAIPDYLSLKYGEGNSNTVEKEQIKTVVIKDGITKIGERAFSQCRYLENVTIADSVTIIDCNAFVYCTSLRTVKMGTGLTDICDYAFSGCTALNSITMPSSLKTIRPGAFKSCISLQSVVFELPADNVGTKTMTISPQAFIDVSETAKVDYSSSGGYKLYYLDNDGKEVFIDNVYQIVSDSSYEAFILGWKIPTPTYTVTIPADVQIQNTEGTYGGTANISAEYNYLGAQTLKVEVSSAYGYKLAEVGEDGQPKSGGYEIPYTLKANNAGIVNGVVFETTEPSGEVEVPLNFEVVNPNDVYAGTYTDTLTFSISLGNSGS